MGTFGRTSPPEGGKWAFIAEDRGWGGAGRGGEVPKDDASPPLYTFLARLTVEFARTYASRCRDAENRAGRPKIRSRYAHPGTAATVFLTSSMLGRDRHS